MFFTKMFAGYFLEGHINQNEVKITLPHPTVFKELVKYMYCGLVHQELCVNVGAALENADYLDFKAPVVNTLCDKVVKYIAYEDDWFLRPESKRIRANLPPTIIAGVLRYKRAKYMPIGNRLRWVYKVAESYGLFNQDMNAVKTLSINHFRDEKISPHELDRDMFSWTSAVETLVKDDPKMLEYLPSTIIYECLIEEIAKRQSVFNRIYQQFYSAPEDFKNYVWRELNALSNRIY